MPIQTRGDEAIKYRTKMKNERGEAAWLAEQARKKRERRAVLRAQRNTEVRQEEKNPPNDDLFEKIYKAKQKIAKSNGKTIKEASVKQQYAKINNLCKKMTNKANCSDFDFLKDTDKVVKFINANWKTDNSRNSQIQAISSILIALPEYKKQYNFYSNLSTKNRININEQADKNELSDKEKANILPWNELKLIYKNPKITNRNRALLALYTLLPPRRTEEISLLTIMDSEVDLDDSFNYVIMNGTNPVKLVYLRYKTDKSYGKIKIPIPTKLKTILKAYISEYKLDNGDALFGTTAGRYYKNFSSEISKVFEKYTQKKITANLIRHSFITHYLSKKRSTADKKKIAMLMGHSIESQSAYDRIDL